MFQSIIQSIILSTEMLDTMFLMLLFFFGIAIAFAWFEFQLSYEGYPISFAQILSSVLLAFTFQMAVNFVTNTEWGYLAFIILIAIILFVGMFASANDRRVRLKQEQNKNYSKIEESVNKGIKDAFKEIDIKHQIRDGFKEAVKELKEEDKEIDIGDINKSMREELARIRKEGEQDEKREGQGRQ